MDRIDEILFLYEDDRVEMQKGGFVVSDNKQKSKLKFTKKHDAFS